MIGGKFVADSYVERKIRELRSRGWRPSEKPNRYMSDGEIRQSYRLAAHPRRQGKILAELNCLPVEKIEEIVGAGKKVKKAKKARKRA